MQSCRFLLSVKYARFSFVLFTFFACHRQSMSQNRQKVSSWSWKQKHYRTAGSRCHSNSSIHWHIQWVAPLKAFSHKALCWAFVAFRVMGGSKANFCFEKIPLLCCIFKIECHFKLCDERVYHNIAIVIFLIKK